MKMSRMQAQSRDPRRGTHAIGGVAARPRAEFTRSYARVAGRAQRYSVDANEWSRRSSHLPLRKLPVGSARDRHEVEADAMAARVGRGTTEQTAVGMEQTRRLLRLCTRVLGGRAATRWRDSGANGAAVPGRFGVVRVYTLVRRRMSRHVPWGLSLRGRADAFAGGAYNGLARACGCWHTS
jgi:hypothetical protein